MATQELAQGVRRAAAAPLIAWAFIRRYPVIPGIIITTMMVGAIFAPLLEPYDPIAIGSVYDRLKPPFFQNPRSSAEPGTRCGTTQDLLGTDSVGRDMLSRIIRASRVTAIVVFVSVSIGTIIGTVLGLVAGYFGGSWLDDVIMRGVDVWAALPQLLIILVITLVFKQSFGVLIFALALVSWAGPVRLVRVEALRLRSMDYVALAKVAGAGNYRVLLRHIAPGVMNVVVVTATLSTGGLILTEATLSFLGAGIPPPNPSWGAMIADGRSYLRSDPWVAVLPGIAILLVVMAGNFLGDWLRDHFDPRLRQVRT